MIIDVLDHGAVRDGSAVTTAALQVAIDTVAVVADGVDGLRLSDLEIRWPDGTLDPDWGDELDSGQWTRPPRSELLRRLADQPPFHAVWLRDCRGGLLDVGGTAASRPGLPAVVQQGSEVAVRA